MEHCSSLMSSSIGSVSVRYWEIVLALHASCFGSSEEGSGDGERLWGKVYSAVLADGSEDISTSIDDKDEKKMQKRYFCRKE